MHNLKILFLSALVPLCLFMTACPSGTENGDDATAEVEAITEDSALEDADDVLKEIENL